MKRTLVIVESPAKAKTIGKFLGRNYKVVASQGHVRDLPKSQLGVDPDNDFAMKYITIHGRGPILAELRKEAKNAGKILLATDPDREGEAIAWHLAQALKLDVDKANRIHFQEITKKAVEAAKNSPQPLNMDLINAQQARRALDRLVGYKISPLLWKKIKKGLSAGRVQSLAVKMLVDRQQDIDAFIPEEYWELSASLTVKDSKGKSQPLTAKLYEVDKKKPVMRSEDEAAKLKVRVEKGNYAVSSVKTKERKRSPAAPFTTSTLQQEASRKLNFNTSRTMRVVQGLYEGVELGKEGSQGLVTYIRTDSVNVSQEAIAQVRDYIKSQYGADKLPKKPNVYKGRASAQNAHEAIRPTDINRTPESVKSFLSRDEFQLYRLIYLRFLASQMTEQIFDTLTVLFEADGTVLRYYGEKRREAGYAAVYEESADEQAEAVDNRMPLLEKGTQADVDEVKTEQFFTQPPQPYTEASLVKALEERGVGRPSTYAPTIATVISRGYVAREKKRLYPTELGIMVNDIMVQYFGSIVDTDFTADMESRLDAIEMGNQDWRDTLRSFYPEFEKSLVKAEAAVEKMDIKEEVSDIPCEECGAMLVYRQGRYGRFLACPNFPNCRYTKPILTYIDAPCPKCQARVLEKTSKKGRRFYGCERYPDCDFVSWDLPVTQRCEVCGSHMVLKRGRGQTWYLCANENCRHKVEAPEDNDE